MAYNVDLLRKMALKNATDILTTLLNRAIEVETDMHLWFINETKSVSKMNEEINKQL